MLRHVKGLPQWFNTKESTDNAGDAGDMGLILGLGRSPGEGNGNPLQYYCLENPMDRVAWRATVHGVTKSRAQWSACTRANTHTHTHTHSHIKKDLERPLF